MGKEQNCKELKSTMQTKERSEILKAVCCHFLGLYPIIKIPLLIFTPLEKAVNMIYGAQVSKELKQLWIFGPPGVVMRTLKCCRSCGHPLSHLQQLTLFMGLSCMYVCTSK